MNKPYTYHAKHLRDLQNEDIEYRHKLRDHVLRVMRDFEPIASMFNRGDMRLLLDAHLRIPGGQLLQVDSAARPRHYDDPDFYCPPAAYSELLAAALTNLQLKSVLFVGLYSEAAPSTMNTFDLLHDKLLQLSPDQSHCLQVILMAANSVIGATFTTHNWWYPDVLCELLQPPP